jgi:SAM-dependent methyltransferase
VNEGLQSLSVADWHQRYTQQGEWTQNIRRHLFAKAQLNYNDLILEIGSGTGAILDLLNREGYRQLYGIDINYPNLVFSQGRNASYYLTQADGYRLPFYENSFALSFCHYLLLWLDNPSAMLTEMVRVTRPGGCILALAEPDHQARIDYPPPLDTLGSLQTKALAAQGVDVQLGRKLGALFQEVGLTEVDIGILGAQWNPASISEVDETEWLTLQADLVGKLPEMRLANYREVEETSRTQGERILFIPTFYAIGRINKLAR